jgi:hypothetical protein
MPRIELSPSPPLSGREGWPSKENFMAVAEWLWGMMDRTDRLLSSLDQYAAEMDARDAEVAPEAARIRSDASPNVDHVRDGSA